MFPRGRQRQKKGPADSSAFLRPLFTTDTAKKISNLYNIISSRTFGTINDLKAHPSAFFKGFEAFIFDSGIMYENILSTILFDKTKTF